MPTATLVKMEHPAGLATLTRLQFYKDKSRRRKKRMAARRSDSLQQGNDPTAGFSARVKRFHSKSRKGCLTCRQRRVKCDEQRNPNCLRCDKGGYVCEWQDSRPGRSRASDDRLSGTTTRSPSLATVNSDDDSSSHSFFSRSIVATVASLFTTMAESFIRDPLRSQHICACISNFYYRFVWQASRSSSIIQKTLTALCGLFERSQSRESSPKNHEHITRYNEAVTELRTSSRELAPDVVLIASILFANCEYLIGDLCSAVRQLRAGARILLEHRRMADDRLSPELSETLGAIFQAFDHDAVDLECPTPSSDYLDTIADNQFNDLSQANENLLQMYTHTFALKKVGQTHPSHILPAAHEFQRWSTSWRQRTVNLEHSLSMDHLPWLQLLHGQQTALNTVVDDLASTIGEGPQEHQMGDLVFQISTFLQACPNYFQHPDDQSRPYMENVGLILPLLLVTLRCKDAQTCETALSLLLRLKVAEGTINSCCAHAVGRAIVNSRHATKFNSHAATDTFDDFLPAAEIKKVTPLNSGTELDLTISFPAALSESNAIVGGFCETPGSKEDLCRMLEGGGFQGPLLSGLLHDCLCYENL